MADTWGDVLNKLKVVAAERDIRVTDESLREAVLREFSDLMVEGFDPTHPAPEISREEYDNLADLLMDE